MKKLIEVKLSPKQAADSEFVRKQVLKVAGVSTPDTEIPVIQRRRSIDARGRHPLVVLGCEVYIDEPVVTEPPILSQFRNVQTKKQVLIVGAGPAGYFAALELLLHGIKPIVLERGKDVRERRKDLRAIQQFGVVNPHSNYCFGEGGAGTYSDGKLYTRSDKRGDIRRALRLLVEHGASEEILLEVHPHIGSNKLPKVVAAMRDTIEQYGGEVHFNAHVTDFIVEHSAIRGVVVNDTDEVVGDAVILATGHSARDIFSLCKNRAVTVEAKPFAMGVRIEHPQILIDKIQYKQQPRDQYLPASSYRLAAQIENRGVYSFCMCPGGLIVPAATAPGETVVNGMSMSRRDSAFANSGIVVEITPEDWQPYSKHGEFAGLEYQKEMERIAFTAGGDETQRAPAQRVVDFAQGVMSATLPKSSYIPGVHAAPLHAVLPKPIAQRLQRAFVEFGKQMREYYTNDAVIVGVESRTSSPVKIPRNNETLQHITIQNLYPCGEGAGYAGGIISAAMDGARVARQIASVLV
ncbi:MAG: FAD-dependent oxidoreductase [Bacteriodetes bacterium]|nr:FAD-dependent oxidoreductase [Bacteroidota bacterium]